MSPAFVSVLATLLVLVNATANEGSSLCAEVKTSTPLVTSGSPVNASCVVRDDCLLAEGQDVHIQWHLDRRLLRGSLARNESAKVSRVFIPSFTEDTAHLTCCIQGDGACQIVGGVEIRAGFPPPIPQNLSCVTNLTIPSTLLCVWDPGRNTHLPTRYTLHTHTSDVPDSKTYELPEGIHRYSIPRSDLFLYSEMEIFVKAVNALGQVTSESLFLEPLRAAKFDPPKIMKVQAEPNGCLQVSWRMSDQLAWVSRLDLEVLLKPADSKQGNEHTIPFTTTRRNSVKACRLFHGTEYHLQVRVRYQQQSPWSGWSSIHTGVTQERAPTGRIDSWLKVPREQRQNPLRVHLFWKPSEQFHANGKNVSYVVSLQRPPADRRQLCATAARHCNFQLPRGAKRVFLTVTNAAGKSSPTEVLVYQPRDPSTVSDVRVSPHGDTSLRVDWTAIASPDITGYVVEWRPLCDADESLLFFDQVDRNQSHVVISEGIEPFKPYGITVYPRYKHGIGLARTVEEYSRQKAPSTAPNLQVLKNWHSHIELTWDEIPTCKRNGVVRSYRVFYWDEQGHGKDVDANLAERRVTLKDLSPMWSYKAFIMVSTDGGSLNGSEILITTMSIDAMDIVFSVIAAGVALALLVIITVMACFTKHERLKTCFWPMVPDPANSSIKSWTTTDTIQDINPTQDMQESSPVYLSHLSLLGPSKMALEKGGVEIPWQQSGSSDLGESISGSPLSLCYSESQQESVSYASVVFAAAYTSQAAAPSRVYLRSESTQPLLEDEPPSPKQYENMSVHNHTLPGELGAFREFQDALLGQGGSGSLWDDFPLLRALAMNDIESEI